MPISDRTLDAEWNRYLAVWEEASLDSVLAHASTHEPRVQPWWFLLVHRRDGRWSAIRFAQLIRFAEHTGSSSDTTVGRLDEMVEVEALEVDECSSYEAERRARRSPADVVAVTENGLLSGIVSVPTRSAELVSWNAVRPAEPLGELLISDGDRSAEEERFTDVSCPRRVWSGSRRFTASFQLTVRPERLSLVQRRVWVSSGPIQVDLVAEGCRPLGPTRQQIDVVAGEDSSLAVFHLAPGGVGSARLTFELFRGAQQLGMVQVAVEITGSPVSETQAEVQPIRLDWERDVPAPQRLLRIIRDPGASQLVFTLVSEEGTLWQEFEPIRLVADPAELSSSLFRSVSLETSGRVDLDPEDLDRRLKALGHDLWRTLVPRGLRELYAAERDCWRDTSLVVLSDEPDLPWELLWPYGDGWEDDEPWCLSLRLSRWLRRDEQGHGNAGAPGRLTLRSMSRLVPRDSGLAAAQAENDFLIELMRSRGIEDSSPQEARWRQVITCLEAGDYDWFHAAAHGRFFPGQLGAQGVLGLEEGEMLAPEHLTGPSIEGHLRSSRPAFVFNACETGQLGLGLTGLSGWAHRLVGAGAGLFLAPRWAVKDRLALLALRAFYLALFEGHEVAEACREARRASRIAGDTTWLAYCLYAHPCARLRLSG